MTIYRSWGENMYFATKLNYVEIPCFNTRLVKINVDGPSCCYTMCTKWAMLEIGSPIHFHQGKQYQQKYKCTDLLTQQFNF